MTLLLSCLPFLIIFPKLLYHPGLLLHYHDMQFGSLVINMFNIIFAMLIR